MTSQASGFHRFAHLKWLLGDHDGWKMNASELATWRSDGEGPGLKFENLKRRWSGSGVTVPVRTSPHIRTRTSGVVLGCSLFCAPLLLGTGFHASAPLDQRHELELPRNHYVPHGQLWQRTANAVGLIDSCELTRTGVCVIALSDRPKGDGPHFQQSQVR